MASKKLSKPQPFLSTPPSDSSPDDELFARMELDAGMGLAICAEEGEPGEDTDPLDGPAFGPTFLEKLLLGIIDANPVNSGQTRRQRLNAAMLALVGRKSTGNPTADDLDDRALLWMKNQQFVRSLNRRKPSDLELGKEAAAKFFPGFNPKLDKSIAHRLREKFAGTYDKKQDKGRTVDVPRELAYRALEHDYLAESVEHQMLIRIGRELADAGVRFSLPD